jgi:TRAP transporter TAXI family solute receptor
MYSYSPVNRKWLSNWSFFVLIVTSLWQPVAAEAIHPNFTLFRIGTGGAQGTYYPVGALLAPLLSDEPKICISGQTDCNVYGLLSVAQFSNGSVANVHSLTAKLIEAGLVQADVAYWAYSGTEAFSGEDKHHKLRAVANLYPEAIHLVTRKDSGIRSVADLKGRRVSLDEFGSGTLVDARLILKAAGLSESDLKTIYLKPQFAGEKLLEGQLDAYFIIAGYPTKSVANLASRAGIRLVPIQGRLAKKLKERYPFFTRLNIPAGVYEGIGATKTLAVGAQLLVNADSEDDLIYRITAALWSERARHVLVSGHPIGQQIQSKNALFGVKIPFHPGAKRYYRETGLWKQAK